MKEGKRTREAGLGLGGEQRWRVPTSMIARGPDEAKSLRKSAKFSLHLSCSQCRVKPGIVAAAPVELGAHVRVRREIAFAEGRRASTSDDDVVIGRWSNQLPVRRCKAEPAPECCTRCLCKGRIVSIRGRLHSSYRNCRIYMCYPLCIWCCEISKLRSLQVLRRYTTFNRRHRTFASSAAASSPVQH